MPPPPPLLPPLQPYLQRFGQLVQYQKVSFRSVLESHGARRADAPELDDVGMLERLEEFGLVGQVGGALGVV